LRSRTGIAAALLLSSATVLSAAPAGGTDSAIFGGGCFWCEEPAFTDVPGVLSVTSGYSGGHVKNPTYEQVSSGQTGHAEVVEVVFDPAKVTYEQLLQVFWHNVDPFQKDGQFCDHGSQYRSAIFFRGDAQKKAAEASKAKLEEEPRFKGKIATEITAAGPFYRAEEYHQSFCKKDPIRYNAYRLGCRRDVRLKQIWGDAAGGHK
jgi:peptide-methionine (S)-S-oxide reductase